MVMQVHQAALRCAKLSSACAAATSVLEAGSGGDVATSLAEVQQYVTAVRAEREARQQVMATLRMLLRKQVRIEVEVRRGREERGRNSLIKVFWHPHRT